MDGQTRFHQAAGLRHGVGRHDRGHRGAADGHPAALCWHRRRLSHAADLRHADQELFRLVLRRIRLLRLFSSAQMRLRPYWKTGVRANLVRQGIIRRQANGQQYHCGRCERPLYPIRQRPWGDCLQPPDRIPAGAA